MSAAKSGTMSAGESTHQNFPHYPRDVLLCSLKPKRKRDKGKKSELHLSRKAGRSNSNSFVNAYFLEHYNISVF
jgi:hypothetical protein